MCREVARLTDKDQETNGAGSVWCGRHSRHTVFARWLNPNPQKALLAFCVILLILWGVWWAVSYQRQALQAGKHFWFKPCYVGMACDFYRHVDHPARIWWNGGDPYVHKEIFFPYPPSEMRLFAWVNLMTPRMAFGIWLIVMAAIITLAAWTASRWRRRLSLAEIPPLAAVTIILFSTPVLYAMERGQYDALSLLVILTALPLLNHQSRWAQFLAGAVLCLAPWIKVYPGLVFVGLLGLRRWRALAGFVVAGLVIAIAFLYTGEMQGFLVNNAVHINQADKLTLWLSGKISPWNHPLSTALAGFWLGTKFNWLGLLPGKIMAGMLVLSLLAWVTYHVYRCSARDALTYPYLLWIVALATFVPPISNDYNLIFLPLAVLAVWDRRDPLLVHVALALLLIWWQPIGMSINGVMLLVFKVLGLCAVAVCLVERAHEQSNLVATVKEY